jgi:hypothetical protein
MSLPDNATSGLADWLILLWMVYWDLKNRQHNSAMALDRPDFIEGAHPQGRYWAWIANRWPWLLAGVAATLIAWLPIILPYVGVGEPKAINGTADIPAQSWEATISVPVSLPYSVRGLTPDWNANVWVSAKESGQFVVGFNTPAPKGGGELDWEVIPRAGTHSVAVTATDVAMVTPTATPTPKPWQSFAENLYAGQVFAHEIQQNPIPGPHTVSIVATDASHQFAKMLLAWLQGFQGNAKWTVVAHGQPDALIGEPSEYALDDGITIRARVGSVDAETLRLAFRVMGLDVHRVILPDSDARTYPIIEIGNIPADQR